MKSKKQKKHISKVKYLIVDGKCYELDINERLVVKFPKLACRDMESMLKEICDIQKNAPAKKDSKIDQNYFLSSDNINISNNLDLNITYTDSLNNDENKIDCSSCLNNSLFDNNFFNQDILDDLACNNYNQLCFDFIDDIKI